jgi:Uma2 family endonuclease
MIRPLYPRPVFPRNGYPESDGKPMAETDIHRDLMFELIAVLKGRYAADPNVYVSGNLLMFYQPGDKRKHVSPDCFVVFGVPDGFRPNYLTWEEGKGPDVVIELTSKSTRREDQESKFELYRDVLKVKEYFLFDPEEDYLSPSLQGYRLRSGAYQTVRPKAGRLPCQTLGVHLERDGDRLRLWDPLTALWLPSLSEQVRDGRRQVREEQERAEVERERAEVERERAEVERERAEVERERAEAEQRKAEGERKKADTERKKADTERKKADEERKKADEERQKADEERQKADEERKKNAALEAEVARLKRLLGGIGD